MKPVVLLTDFGDKDGFAGVLKGVILSINPEARVIDLSHGVEPFNVLEAALILKAHYSYFPKGSVFVCVVDPGVGSERRALALECGDYSFVAPDNGLLDLVVEDIKSPPKVVVIENKKYLLPKRNDTFHGRDVFSPVAAHLSKGVPLEEMGSAVEYVPRLGFPKSRRVGEWIEGEIVYFDRFGNAVSNIPCGDYRYGVLRGEKLKVVSHFLASPKGEPALVCGSFGFMEVFLPMDNAKETLKLRVGETLRVFIG